MVTRPQVVNKGTLNIALSSRLQKERAPTKYGHNKTLAQ
jgi:hypothetical protein